MSERADPPANNFMTDPYRRPAMEYLGVGLLAVLLIVAAVVGTRLMRRTGRNDDATHGGGWAGTPTDLPNPPD